MIDLKTWTFINTFAPWLSALGTIAAVVVALVLARRASRVRLRVRSGMYRTVGYGQRVSESPLFFQITAVNIGPRPATVSGIMWQIAGFRKRHFVMIPPVNPMSSKLPTRVDQGGETCFFFTEAEFKGGIEEFIKVLRRSRWPKLALRQFKVGVYTNTGDEYLTRIDPSVREVLLERLEAIKRADSNSPATGPTREACMPKKINEYHEVHFQSNMDALVAATRLQDFLASPEGVQHMAATARPVIWSLEQTLYLSNGAFDIAKILGLNVASSTTVTAGDLPDGRSLILGDAIDWH